MDDQKEFEDEVCRVARELWPDTYGDGPKKIGGRERDGIFETDESIHIIEATVSRRKDKAVKDAKKIIALIDRFRKSNRLKAVKGWFVTKEEPTADQRAAIEKYKGNIAAVSYETFRSRLINAPEYLELRQKYPFGSVRKPNSNDIDDTDAYVPMDLCSESGETFSIAKISADLLKGRHFLVLGDYGAGKSTTMREIFLKIRKEYFKKRTIRFPVLINLRDHHGQQNAAEALERHARNIGFTNSSHLVRAWRAGNVVLLIDGFDEMGSAGWVGKAKKLKDLRYQSTTLIREFCRDNPSNSGLIVAGRAHYFDSENELIRSLGIKDETINLSLNDFTEEQVNTYLRNRGWEGEIPSWFPSRPLLLGYLASKNLLIDAAEFGTSVNVDPAQGWDMLLSKISERESHIEIGIDGETVRRIIERVATRARCYVQGLGPLQQEDLITAFKDECGYEPDDKGVVLLQRLPGLGVANLDDGSREFIDKDLVDVARAGDVINYINDPFNVNIFNPSEWQNSIEAIGRDVAILKCGSINYTTKKMSAALEKAGREESYDYLSSDIFQILAHLGNGYSGDRIDINDVVIHGLCLDHELGDFSRITFTDCLIQHLEMGIDLEPNKLPRFEKCWFGTIDGAFSRRDLPDGVFRGECSFDTFGEGAQTTSAILDTSLPLSTKVMLTVLKKLYFQAGGGRKYSALLRGLDHKARRLIDDVLKLLRQEGLVIASQASSEPVWLPVRRYTARVKKLIAAPTRSDDPILAEIKNID